MYELKLLFFQLAFRFFHKNLSKLYRWKKISAYLSNPSIQISRSYVLICSHLQYLHTDDFELIFFQLRQHSSNSTPLSSRFLPAEFFKKVMSYYHQMSDNLFVKGNQKSLVRLRRFSVAAILGEFNNWSFPKEYKCITA